MNEICIKKEFFNINLPIQCRTCLSVGRKLSKLGDLKEIFAKIVTNNDFLNNPDDVLDILLCWECISLLNNVRKFLIKVERANFILNNKQDLMSLSSLTNVTNNENKEIIYLSNSNDEKINKNLTNQEYLFDNSAKCCTNYDDFEFIDFNQEKVLKQNCSLDEKNIVKNNSSENKIKNEHKINKVKSKWALKKAETNRKIKYRILESNFENLFVRVRRNDSLCGKESDGVLEKGIKCGMCFQNFKKFRDFLEHFNNFHSKITPYICNTCHNIFEHKSKLIHHIQEHSYIYKCVVCMSVCTDTHEHTRVHRKIFQCIPCGVKFGNRRDFYTHYKKWHENYICDYCGISFKLKYCIKDHIRKRHTPLKCTPCGKSFPRYNSLWLHNKLCHTDSLPAYCVECNRHYDTVYKYRWHLSNSVVHTKRKRARFPCPDCKKVFTKKIYMKDHYNLVHLEVYKYRCEQCNKNFVRNAELVKHNKRVHEGIMPAKNKICNVCGKGFTTNKVLYNHIRTHSGEKPFQCDVCTARYSQSASLNAHIREKHNK